MKSNKLNKGFTLIEVMIVLAIVGILLLAIFLVVPAAQRGSRNSGRRRDVSKLVAIINEHITNNGGYVLLGGTTTICGGVSATACPATPTSANIQITNETFSQYTTGATISVTAAGTNPQAAPTALNAITIYPGTECSGADATTVGAAARQFTANFLTETAAGTTKSCIES